MDPAQGGCIFYILEMIYRKKEIALNVFDHVYVFRGTERKHEVQISKDGGMGWKFAKALTEECQHKKSTKESSLIFILPNRDLKSGGKLGSGNIEDLLPYLRCSRKPSKKK